MGIFKHIIHKSIDTHFDKQVAANVGMNAANAQYYNQNQKINTVQPINTHPNNQIQIADPKLYAEWQAKEARENAEKQKNTSSSELDIKKAELMTELLKQGKTPDEALEYVKKIFS